MKLAVVFFLFTAFLMLPQWGSVRLLAERFKATSLRNQANRLQELPSTLSRLKQVSAVRQHPIQAVFTEFR